MKRNIVGCAAACVFAVAFVSPTRATTFTVLHSFADSPTDGGLPKAGLTISGNTLYGTTYDGGAFNEGTAFSLSTSGGATTILHSFGTAGTSDGQYPVGGLTLVGSTLYGATSAGGSGSPSDYGPAGFGTVYSLSVNGGPITILHDFANSSSDGNLPFGSVLVVGSTIYGTTNFGGGSGDGTVYSLSTGGGATTILHSFTGTATDGNTPEAGVIIANGMLYGTTVAGGANGLSNGPGSASGDGTLYSLNASGGATTLLHSFSTAKTDGLVPVQGSLTVVGNTLYGTTYAGGTVGDGTIYEENLDGTGFKLLHSFDDADGFEPLGGMILVGSTLYGTASDGGPYGSQQFGDGVIFEINTDGSGFQVLHDFTNSDGSVPYGGLVYANSTLYGTAYSGGAFNHGTVFALTVPEPSSILLAVLGVFGLGFWRLKWRSNRPQRMSRASRSLCRV